jgi:hypothetical protein
MKKRKGKAHASPHAWEGKQTCHGPGAGMTGPHGVGVQGKSNQGTGSGAGKDKIFNRPSKGSMPTDFRKTKGRKMFGGEGNV